MTLSDCYYCGNSADTKDHIIPVCWKVTKRPKKATAVKYCGETVDCCRECNSMLGSKALFSIPERADEIAKCLERRYRKELNAAYWSEEELEELEGELKQTVKAKQFLRQEVLERIRNATSVACGLLERALPLYTLN